MRPLQAVRVIVDCWDHGDPVPPAAAAIVARALRLYLAGQTDITQNLGLRPNRGATHETPWRLVQASNRNNSILAIYEAMPGDTQKARAEQTALLLSKPPDPRITEADVFAHLSQLYENHAGTLPKSSRQVIRIVTGDTVAERRK
jgi:hypothetical protein